MRRAWAAVAMAMAMAIGAIGCTDDDGDDAASSSSTTTTLPPFDASFSEGPCPVETEEPIPDRVTCGTVVVPERHADPDGPTIELAVARIEPEDATGAAPDPLVLLQGGPGSGFVDALPFLLEEPIVDDRTTVLVDPRGTGYSEPSLGCPELQDLYAPLLALDPDDADARAQQHDAVVACHDRLVGDGVDLAAYSYTEIAADLAVLREALGYDEWNLYGISNGGRMALEVLRRHPDGIRSVVLDATASPQGNLLGELWEHGARAFEVLADGCERDPSCNAAHPDLDDTLARLLDQLAAEPVVVDTEDSATGQAVTVRIDEERGAETLRRALYDSALIATLPHYIDLLADGQAFTDVAGLIAAGATGPDLFSDGMRMSVNCQEEIAFLDEEHFDEIAAALPEPLTSVVEDPVWLDECDVWDVGKADPSIEEVVHSDVPTLLLVGEYDPVHPRSTADEAAAGLSHAQVFDVPGLGHGTVRVHECPRSMARAFLVEPDAPIDDACLADMPAPAWLP